MEGRVLVVEDDASIREVTALGLRRAGLRVSTAGDGGTALATWRSSMLTRARSSGPSRSITFLRSLPST